MRDIISRGMIAGLSRRMTLAEDQIGYSKDGRIWGASWTKVADPALTRTDSAVGLTANAGVDSATVTNDFDYLPIFGEVTQVTDTLGNVFIRIPKFYIRKTDGVGSKTWQVSKVKYPGFYLPWCFWDFTNSKELPYIDVGKYKSSKAATKLQSVADAYPLILDTIINFRTHAGANNADGLLGYQMLDVHVVDVLQTLFRIEFATLNSQSIMAGFTAGQYSAGHTATAATSPAGNSIVVTNAVGAFYRVGQVISCGTTLGGNQKFYGRTITAINADTPGAGSTTITFDGTAVELAIGDTLYNSGWKNGFSSAIAASSGSLVSNATGLYPCVYRGIESPWGDIWQFVDGVNINEYQAWVATNAANYASNVFASPYVQLGYVNYNADGYTTSMGYDANYPFAPLPTAVGGSEATYYGDNYYRAAGQRIALVGGSWSAGGSAGLSCWDLNPASSSSAAYFGGRLVRKAL